MKSGKNMLKNERQQRIVDKVNQEGVVTVNDIIQELEVSDMTVRRDLDKLEKEGLLSRIHGGAQSITLLQKQEKSNSEKQAVQIKEKQEIAKVAADLINDGETIFIGPGTTLEFLAQELINKKIRIVTNSLPVFSALSRSTTVDLLLIGGEYRSITGAFTGSLTQSNIGSLKFAKAFISCNGIYNNDIATYSETEGNIQKLAFENSIEKFLLADSQKFNVYDFCVFYHLSDLTALITDSGISKGNLKKYGKLTRIFTAKSRP